MHLFVNNVWLNIPVCVLSIIQKNISSHAHSLYYGIQCFLISLFPNGIWYVLMHKEIKESNSTNWLHLTDSLREGISIWQDSGFWSIDSHFFLSWSTLSILGQKAQSAQSLTDLTGYYCPHFRMFAECEVHDIRSLCLAYAQGRKWVKAPKLFITVLLPN